MPSCFVIMPFRPELGYLYKLLRSHIEATFPGVTVQRGDDQILTRPILDKIKDFIQQADVVIADCSGRNPNVFYELGMAHAFGKSVVLVTSDEIEEAPTDVRAFEFISYAKATPDAFFASVDKALAAIVGSPFDGLYPDALALFEEFRLAVNLPALPDAATENEFLTAMQTMQANAQPLPRQLGRKRTEYLVRGLLGVQPAIGTFNALGTWLDQKYP